jgi:chorismate lyase/3-hydroxybenzoate synthase
MKPGGAIGTATLPFAIDYRDGADAAAVLADDRVLAAIGYGSFETEGSADPRLVAVPLHPVGRAAPLEVWTSPHTVRRGTAGGVRFAEDGRLLFGWSAVEEQGGSIAAITYAAYRTVVRFCRDTGFPHLIRVSNVVPDINGEQDGLERYRAFCRGRYLALARALVPFEANLPAASAIGSRSGPLLLCFLAGRDAGIGVENPRQLSAYRYPRRYGPKSPSFSRSVLLGAAGGGACLLISGTASIVGHESRHEGDLFGQLAETLDNLDALLGAAVGRLGRALRLSAIKVYLRGSGPAEEIEDRVARRLGAGVPRLVLRGDICRSDLLLEIEGVAVERWPGETLR